MHPMYQGKNLFDILIGGRVVINEKSIQLRSYIIS